MGDAKISQIEFFATPVVFFLAHQVKGGKHHIL